MDIDASNLTTRRALITGFGPFGDVTFNPSGAIAEALAADPPRGWLVTAAVLPVTYAGAPLSIDRALASADGSLDVLLGLGVHPGHAFDVERRARAAFFASRPDTSHLLRGDEGSAATLFTSFDTAQVAQDLQCAGAGAVVLSDDAGQYVCERTYHHLLRRARELHRGALFIHVPPDVSMSHTRQADVMRAFLERIVLPVHQGD